MQTNFRTRAVVYAIVILLGLLAALPNVLPQRTLEKLPNWYAASHLTLGLDLRGGSHLLLEVDTDDLVNERTLQLGETLGRLLHEEGIRASQPSPVDTGVRLIIRDPAQLEKAKTLAHQAIRDDSEGRASHFSVSTERNALLLTPNANLRNVLTDDAVERSLEVVRRRMDETGVVEPLITRQGNTGVLVQLPGVEDPGRIKQLLGRTARLTFHLVTDGHDGTATLNVPGAAGDTYTLTRTPLLEGGHLTDARMAFDQRTGEPVVNFKLNKQGAERFGLITRDNVGRPFAVVLDGKVITAPVIRTPITGGAGQISGGFTSTEATDLALLLRAGALPAPLHVVEERTVGPELGGDSIRMGLTTGLIGAALVLAFMFAVYRRWGLIANTALVINIGLVIGILGALGATLTLPGIAGLILTVGMAVDANILINERIREETRRGKSAAAALQAGFDRAYSTILDSNITTLIAVGLLFSFGSGPVRGFAVTMAVGLLVSLFTAVAFTRLVMEWRVRHLRRQPLVIPGLGFIDRFTGGEPIRFMNVRAMGLVLSAVLSLASIGLLFKPGLTEGIDFRGGTAVEVQTGSSTPIESLRSTLQQGEGLHDVSIQQFGHDGHFLVRLPAAPDAATTSAQVDEVRDAVRALAPDATFPRVDVVGPSVSSQFIEGSILAVLLAGAGMFFYLRFRFEPWFAIGAMATLALDLTKTLGFFALTGIEFNLTAIAALLTLIGYSVNDKVVVFDRMRENQRLHPDMPMRELINRSLTSTLTRTLFTSITTFLAILPMGLAGGDAVASFALPLLFGIVVGTSSSIFIAAPMVLILGSRMMRKRAEDEARKASLPAAERAFMADPDRP